MKRLFPAVFLFPFVLTLGLSARAQEEGPVKTQVLVGVDAKSTPPSSASEITISVNDRKEPVSAWAAVQPANAQVALLIDSGLRESVGRELENLRKFVADLPPGVEVMVGYLQYGSVVSEQGFTSDHASAASNVHLPAGMPGVSASPYLCISDFVKKWPGSAVSSSDIGLGAPVTHKARFILVLTNGVDPYNGSTSVMNQDSPYVATAVEDAQRAGVVVYSIYFGGAGIGGESANFSGQGYLTQLTQETGGVNYYQGTRNPVSMAPFLDMFRHAVSETYIATFNAPARKDPRDMMRVKISAPKAKLRAPEEVRPGNQE
jgi:hypothetical protein